MYFTFSEILQKINMKNILYCKFIIRDLESDENQKTEQENLKWYSNNCKDSLCCYNTVCLIVTESLHIVCWSTKYTFVHKVLNAGAHCSEMHLTSTEGLDVYNDKIKLDGSS